MANSLPYYPMYPKDCDTDRNIRLMDDCQLGLFLRCLNDSWTNNGLPADPEEICRSFRDEPITFRSKWVRVEPCFPISEDGLRRNPRQEQERIKAAAKYQAAAKAGRTSGAIRRKRKAISTERQLDVRSQSVRTEFEHSAFEGASNSASGSYSLSSSVSDVEVNTSKNHKPSTRGREVEVLDPVEAAVQQTADRLVSRHPAHRRCSRPVAQAKLRTILKHKKPPDPIDFLGRLDINHADNCNSEGWQSGFDNGLKSWLNPMEELYMNPPRQEIRKLTKSEQSLCDAAMLFDNGI